MECVASSGISRLSVERRHKIECHPSEARRVDYLLVSTAPQILSVLLAPQQRSFQGVGESRILLICTLVLVGHFIYQLCMAFDSLLPFNKP